VSSHSETSTSSALARSLPALSFPAVQSGRERLSLALSLSFSKKLEDYIGGDLVLYLPPQPFNYSEDLIITSKGRYQIFILMDTIIKFDAFL
jgi:hypothetical protein